MEQPKYKTDKLITGEEKLKELIKRLIRQEIDEMTGTSAAAMPATKFAFGGGKSGSKKATNTLKSMGFTVSRSIGEEMDDKLNKLEEAVSRYKRFKEYPMKHPSKISLAIQEINKMLREIDFLMSVNDRLKTELNVPTESLWKRTESRIAEIRVRLKSIETKLGNIRK